jgi:histidinol phosphatase-like PHP family hydrolase
MLKPIGFFLLVTLLLPALALAQEGWIPLFDGKTLDGWKANDSQTTWKVVDGQVASDGPRSHLFYSGKVLNADFKNFELKADVLTKPGTNSGIYFHTEFQEQGFPSKGFEVQVCNTCGDPNASGEKKRTGSLYALRNVYKRMAKDDEWFQMHIVVRGKQVQVLVNDVLVVDFVEPDPPAPPSNMPGRLIAHGTFALQGHDPTAHVFYKNIAVRPLPDDAKSTNPDKPVVDDVYRDIIRLSGGNTPLVDFHTHLKGSLPLASALANSRRTGIFYGIPVNCGLGNQITNDAGAEAFLKTMAGQPAFAGMQAEGREWVKMFSKDTVAKFDYVITDSMTFTDDNGRRMRLWIKQEVPEIKDKQAFMDMLVSRIVGILNNEPIDIYVNPTFLPDQIAAEYEQLWTPERMQKVIDAAKKNDVAIEINNRYKLPSVAFLKAARAAGVKFSCGTNNEGAELGRDEYCLQMMRECGLRPTDFFLPKPDGQKPVQKRGL